MKRVISAMLLLTTLCGCGRVAKSDGEVAIIPRPASVERGEGVFRVSASTPLVLLFEQEGLHAVAAAFNRIVEPILGKALVCRTATERQVEAINIACDEQLAPEAYRLTITPEAVDILCGGAPGAFYAVQTLRQLIPLEAFSDGTLRGVELPAVTIGDAPCLSYRGTMLDVGRHFFTVAEVKQLLDIMAMHKLNTFHWHLTDDQGWRIEIKKYPELTRIGSVRKRTLIGKDPGGEYDETCRYDETPHGGFYTQEEIREVVRYAAERFITVIPEVEFPGHAVAALASYPWLSCTGEHYEVRQTWDIDDRVFCVGKETTFEFIENVLSEVVELFPSTYIHIGGDECPTKLWEQCPLCKARMQQEGLTRPRQLQNYATARVERFLNTHGRRLIGWDEILEGDVTSTATIMSWRGAEGGIQAAQMGNYAIMTPTSYCYLDYYQTDKRDGEPLAWGGFVSVEKSYSLNPYDQLSPEQQRYILGVQATLWTEYISDFKQVQYMLLPRLSALAEVGWSLDRKDYADYLRRLPRLVQLYEQYGYPYAKHVFE